MDLDPDLKNGLLLVLQPLSPRQFGTPAIYRLKRALKALLRSYGFRADYYRELVPGEDVTRPVSQSEQTHLRIYRTVRRQIAARKANEGARDGEKKAG